ncbi:XAP5, circadian clock regulator-domain-containing protein [Lipomyces arxii]|uniref:XAP5, circadian clock regulator-domain-containing protein n=1 Tax=Lipomyces arxii TaxID=56418 RepID=UPI0034CE3283
MNFDKFRKSGTLTPSRGESEPNKSSFGIRQFASQSTNTVEDRIKAETVGLVNLDKLRQLREEVEKSKDELDDLIDLTKRKKNLRNVRKSKLSFDDEDEQSDQIVTKRQKVDSTVDTSFLKSKEAQVLERKHQNQLEQELAKQREQTRQESVAIDFSYFDGSYTPGSVTVKKGEQVWIMLDRTRKGKKEFHRGTVDDILLVKDNIIISHHYEFYYFIEHKITTRAGLLFDFDTPNQDIKRMKVVHRNWYEKNKHIFPASVWKEFDPEIDYSTYVLRDSEGFVYYNQ